MDNQDTCICDLHPDDRLILEKVKEFRSGGIWGYLKCTFQNGDFKLLEEHMTSKVVPIRVDNLKK